MTKQGCGIEVIKECSKEEAAYENRILMGVRSRHKSPGVNFSAAADFFAATQAVTDAAGFSLERTIAAGE